MTEKEVAHLLSVGAVRGVCAVVSVTRSGSWNISFDLANGSSVLLVTARGNVKNYTLEAAASLVHSLGLDRFTVGLHGYAQK